MSCGCDGRLKPSAMIPSVSRDAKGGWSTECTALGAALSMTGAAVGTYHGYKRNQSVGWAVAWGALGAIFPIVVVPLAIAQGLGEPAQKKEEEDT